MTFRGLKYSLIVALVFLFLSIFFAGAQLAFAQNSNNSNFFPFVDQLPAEAYELDANGCYTEEALDVRIKEGGRALCQIDVAPGCEYDVPCVQFAQEKLEQNSIRNVFCSNAEAISNSIFCNNFVPVTTNREIAKLKQVARGLGEGGPDIDSNDLVCTSSDGGEIERTNANIAQRNPNTRPNNLPGQDFIFPLKLNPHPSSRSEIVLGYEFAKQTFYSGLMAGKGHHGTDFLYPKGTPIVAIQNGVVTRSSFDSRGGDANPNLENDPNNPGFGNMLEIEHTFEDGQKYVSRYGHMVAKSEFEVGDIVLAGEVIGFVGGTGRSTTFHLHLEIWECDGSNCTKDSGRPENPDDYGNLLDPLSHMDLVKGNIPGTYLRDVFEICKNQSNNQQDTSNETATENTVDSFGSDISSNFSIPNVSGSALNNTLIQIEDYCANVGGSFCGTAQSKRILALSTIQVLWSEHSPQGEGGVMLSWLEHNGSCSAGDQSCIDKMNYVNDPAKRWGKSVCQYDDLDGTYDLRAAGIDADSPTGTIKDINVCFKFLESKARENFRQGWCNVNQAAGVSRKDFYSEDAAIQQACNTNFGAAGEDNFLVAACTGDTEEANCRRAQQTTLLLYNAAIQYDCASGPTARPAAECNAGGCTTLACWYSNIYFERNGLGESQRSFNQFL